MTNEASILFPEETIRNWARVILPLALPKLYTYSVPENLLDKAQPGCRVEVLFGKTKKYAGIIKSLSTQKPVYDTKPILNVLDDEPLLYEGQLKFWEWLSEYYMCSEGEVMSAALPANFKLSSETIVLYNEEIGEDFSTLNDDEFLVAEALHLKKQLQLTEVQQILDVHQVYPVIKSLIEKKVCFIWEELAERYKIKKENFVVLNPEYDQEEALEGLLNQWKGAPKQMELLLAFLHFRKTEGEVKQPDLLKKSGASAAQLKALAEKNILRIEHRAVDRIKLPPKTMNISVEFSAAQQNAYQEIENAFLEKDICLLHGVTGSGKTLIYIKLIEKYIKQNQQVLYLLPEIALTAQIIRRLTIHFGGNIAIYHSKFNNQERIELWNKVRKGEVKIVLGARSALFLPFKNPGLIIVDEEHDPSYKQQDPAPRYNARDAAILFAAIFKSKVLLGTATPSLESYYNAMQKKYALVNLFERYSGMQLPAIELVNSNQVVRKEKGKLMISPQLKAAIEEAVAQQQQVILFQNRRGYNPYLICSKCAKIPQCIHCDVSLTLHKHSNKLHCHYCGSQYPKLITCPDCGNNQWLEKNFGTEKIEEQLETEFADYRIARMDVDSVRGKNAHDNLIKKFEQKEIDILIGTQMVVKGLDFDNVSLVGILDADGLLNFADFRANERAFQLMEQVSGRAGRKHNRGKVLIQTIQDKHPILLQVQAHDYVKFYIEEIKDRETFFYPPFSRLMKLTLRHKEKSIVDAAAQILAQLLSQDFKPYLLGPATPIIGRIRNQYLQEITLKLPKPAGMGKRYKEVIRNQITLMQSDKRFRAVHVVADVDAS